MKPQFNTFTLKCIALVCMVIDHIALYFEGAPVWFHWIGRIAYPLFLFCMVWGYQYTRDRRKYLLRLYLASLFMTAFGCLVDARFPTENGYGNHNIFLPMLLVGVLISAIEQYQKDRKKGGLLLGGIFLVQFLYVCLPFARTVSGDVLTGIIPNLAHNEYGFAFVALGVLMYFLKERKDLLAAAYIIFCIAQFSEGGGGSSQWYMILALPLMLRYNNEKGPGMKWFFYVFYPAHTFALFYLANFALK